ncbi:MAG: TonB-dependent receptor, partial [Cyanothece sp. SIO2G6]|nr:TonB-dependent receptor [Cyanothece sp. SIO2G6]
PFDSQTENAGKSRLYGGELEVQSFVGDSFEWFASIGYVDTKFEDFESQGVQFAGNEFPNSADWTGAVGGTYFFANGINADFELTHTSDAFSDVQNDPASKSDSRTLVNVGVGYDAGDWLLSAYVRNLFDEGYITTLRTLNRSRVGPPREFGIVFQINFD